MEVIRVVKGVERTAVDVETPVRALFDYVNDKENYSTASFFASNNRNESAQNSITLNTARLMSPTTSRAHVKDGAGAEKVIAFAVRVGEST